MLMPLFVAALLALAGADAESGAALGIFQKSADVGKVSHAGLAKYDAGAKAHTITGGGANIWGSEDAFHYVRREPLRRCGYDD